LFREHSCEGSAVSAKPEADSIATRHTIGFWLRGYCASFARVLAEFIGNPASLGSVLANDGHVHHVVVVLGELVIDARGVNTNESLIEQINREAADGGDLLRATDVIQFQPEHENFF